MGGIEYFTQSVLLPDRRTQYSGPARPVPTRQRSRISGDLRLAIAPPRDIAGEPPRRLAPGLREGGPAFCRKDRLCSVVHSHLFESCKRYGTPARLGRSCSPAAAYPRGSRSFPITANLFPVRPNKFPFRPRTGIGSQPLDSACRFPRLNGMRRPESKNFPVIFPWNREIGA